MRRREPFVLLSGKRRTSFGSQTQAGSTFFARMMTVVTTLRYERRNVVEFMTQAVASARCRQQAPSLRTQVTSSDESQDFFNVA